MITTWRWISSVPFCQTLHSALTRSDEAFISAITQQRLGHILAVAQLRVIYTLHCVVIWSDEKIKTIWLSYLIFEELSDFKGKTVRPEQMWRKTYNEGFSYLKCEFDSLVNITGDVFTDMLIYWYLKLCKWTTVLCKTLKLSLISLCFASDEPDL